MNDKIVNINQNEVVVAGVTKVNSILNYIKITENVEDNILFKKANEYSQLYEKINLTKSVPEIFAVIFLSKKKYQFLRSYFLENSVDFYFKDGVLSFIDISSRMEIVIIKVSNIRILDGLNSLLILKNESLEIDSIPYRLFIFQDSITDLVRYFDLVYNFYSNKSPHYLNDQIEFILDLIDNEESNFTLKELNNNLYITKLLIKKINFNDIGRIDIIFFDFERYDLIFYRTFELVNYLNIINADEVFVEKLIFIFKLVNDRCENDKSYSLSFIYCLIKKYLSGENRIAIDYFEKWYFKKINFFSQFIDETPVLIDDIFNTETFESKSIFVLIDFNKESIPIVETLEKVKQKINKEYNLNIFYRYIREDELLDWNYEIDPKLLEVFSSNSLFIADISMLNHKVYFDLGYFYGTIIKQKMKLVLLSTNSNSKVLPAVEDDVSTHYLNFINTEDLKIKLIEFLTDFYEY